MSTAIAIRGKVGIDLFVALERSGAITPTELILPERLSYEQYESLGAFFGKLKRTTSWLIGDWIRYGEESMGEKYSQAMTATGLSEGTLQNYVYVCRNVAPSRRLQDVPFSVHYEVASMKAVEQRRWLSLARKEGLSQRDLRVRIRQEAAVLAANGDGNALAESGVRGREARVNGSGGDSLPTLPSMYAIPAPICRRLVSEAVKTRDGYFKVPRDLIERLTSIVNSKEGKA